MHHTGVHPEVMRLSGGMLLAQGDTHVCAAVVWRDDGEAAVLHIDASCCVTDVTALAATSTPGAHHVAWVCLGASGDNGLRLARVSATAHAHGSARGNASIAAAEALEEEALLVPADTVLDTVIVYAAGVDQGVDHHEARYSDAWQQANCSPGLMQDITAAAAVGPEGIPTLLVQVCVYD